MATTYHIRTFSSNFSYPYYSGGQYGYSDDNILESYNEVALGAASTHGIRTRPNTVFNTTAQELFLIYGSLQYRQTTPYYSSMDGDDILKLSTTDGYLYWSNYGIRSNATDGYNPTEWVSKGWTSPEISNSTWLTEICTKFNTLKAGSEHSHDDNYNVYVFKYTFSDTPDGVNDNWAYFPVFTKGNDPHYDSQVII